MIRNGDAVERLKGLEQCLMAGAHQKAPYSDCTKIVQIGVFFDGTGQNKDHPDEIERKSHSNIARL